MEKGVKGKKGKGEEKVIATLCSPRVRRKRKRGRKWRAYTFSKGTLETHPIDGNDKTSEELIKTGNDFRNTNREKRGLTLSGSTGDTDISSRFVWSASSI